MSGRGIAPYSCRAAPCPAMRIGMCMACPQHSMQGWLTGSANSCPALCSKLVDQGWVKPGGESQFRVDEVDSENPLRPRYTGECALRRHRSHGLGMGRQACFPCSWVEPAALTGTLL